MKFFLISIEILHIDMPMGIASQTDNWSLSTYKNLSSTWDALLKASQTIAKSSYSDPLFSLADTLK